MNGGLCGVCGGIAPMWHTICGECLDEYLRQAQAYRKAASAATDKTNIDFDYSRTAENILTGLFCRAIRDRIEEVDESEYGPGTITAPEFTAADFAASWEGG